MDFSGESLSLYRELGHLSGVARNLTTLALSNHLEWDFSSPAPWLEEALSIARQIGDPISECDCSHIPGHACLLAG